MARHANRRSGRGQRRRRRRLPDGGAPRRIPVGAEVLTHRAFLLARVQRMRGAAKERGGKSWAPAAVEVAGAGAAEARGLGALQNVPRIGRAPIRQTPSLAIGDQPDSRQNTSRAGNTPYSVVATRGRWLRGSSAVPHRVTAVALLEGHQSQSRCRPRSGVERRRGPWPNALLGKVLNVRCSRMSGRP